MHKYQVIIIGSGPAGISCALTAQHLGISDVLLLDSGPHFKNRKCEVDHYKWCLNCTPCKVISGFGGCIHYEDSIKLSKFPSGKYLYEKLGENRYEDLCKKSLSLYDIEKEFIFSQVNCDFFEIKNYPICIMNSNDVKKIIERSYERIGNDFLKLNTYVDSISVVGDEYSVTCIDQQGNSSAYLTRHLVVATGRKGYGWLKKQIQNLNILHEAPIISFGLRVEMPIEYMLKVGRDHPDLKIRLTRKGRKFKTFCFCAGENGGRLKFQNHGNYTILDGHLGLIRK